MTVLVTGASGNVGGAALAALAGSPDVRALVRRPLDLDVEQVHGDLADPDSLGPALSGVTAMFLLGAFPTLPAVLAKAADAGVERVVLLTSRCVVGGVPDNAITGMWLHAEQALADSGLPGVVLRPSGFQSNVLRWNDQLAAGDVVRYPWADVPIAVIDPGDIGAVAAAALTGSVADGAVELSGPEALTGREQLAVVAEVLGRPLVYEDQPEAEARDVMSAQMPPEFVDANFRLFTAGEFDDSAVVGTVGEILGRPAGTLRDWTAAHRDLFPRTGSA